MTDTTISPTQRIATALQRLRPALAGRPGLGRTTATSVSELTVGMRCVTQEHAWRIESDLGAGLGGEGTAPSPAALVRAALGACLAMGYRLRAAEAGIELSAVRVTVESDSDVRGLLGTDGCEPPGFSALRYHVEIDSPADADVLTGLVELGDRHSPVLDMLARPRPAERTVTFGPLAKLPEA